MLKNSLHSNLTIIPFLFSLLANNSALGQNYSPMPETNVFWGIEHYDSTLPCQYTEKYYYHLNGDTLIQGKNYKKLFYKIEALSCQNVNYPYGFIGGIRQDTINRKVFCSLVSLGHQDTLLYDFNLQIGDTLQRSLVNQLPDPQIIDRIDSLQLLDGTYRRTFHFSPGISGNDSIIEGIGSRFGLLEPFDIGIGEFDVLKCFRSDSDLLISSGSICSITTDVIDISQEINAELYPNPATRSTILKTNANFVSRSLADVNGKVKYFLTNLHTDNYELFLNNFSPGVYFVKIQFKNRHAIKKLVLLSE